MKIPTLIGITLIIVLITLGGFFYYQQKERGTPSVVVADLEVVNIFNTSATVVWQTNTPTIGKVYYSESENLENTASDNRDRGQSQPRTTHFVTINNLKSSTRYFYKISESDSDGKPLEFTTASIPQESIDQLNFSFIKPLRGTILNTNLNPIDESLIFLTIPGAQDLATFSSTAGNFILPLKLVLSQNLDQVFSVSPDTPAKLSIKKGTLQSNVEILISDTNVNLPPIPIGNNLDLINFKPQPLTKITFEAPLESGLDFNGDQKINSLDLALLRETAKPGNLIGTDVRSKFDINSDGVVDQKDIDEFSKALTGN